MKTVFVIKLFIGCALVGLPAEALRNPNSENYKLDKKAKNSSDNKRHINPALTPNGEQEYAADNNVHNPEFDYTQNHKHAGVRHQQAYMPNHREPQGDYFDYSTEPTTRQEHQISEFGSHEYQQPTLGFGQKQDFDQSTEPTTRQEHRISGFGSHEYQQPIPDFRQKQDFDQSTEPTTRHEHQISKFGSYGSQQPTPNFGQKQNQPGSYRSESLLRDTELQPRPENEQAYNNNELTQEYSQPGEHKSADGHNGDKKKYEAEYTPKYNPYKFAYAVKHDPSSNHYSHEQSSDDKGYVQGSYSVSLPDGRLQTVTFTSNPYKGYVADVKYTGEAKYPVYDQKTNVIKVVSSKYENRRNGGDYQEEMTHENGVAHLEPYPVQLVSLRIPEPSQAVEPDHITEVVKPQRNKQEKPEYSPSKDGPTTSKPQYNPSYNSPAYTQTPSNFEPHDHTYQISTEAYSRHQQYGEYEQEALGSYKELEVSYKTPTIPNQIPATVYNDAAHGGPTEPAHFDNHATNHDETSYAHNYVLKEQSYTKEYKIPGTPYSNKDYQAETSYNGSTKPEPAHYDETKPANYDDRTGSAYNGDPDDKSAGGYEGRTRPRDETRDETPAGPIHYVETKPNGYAGSTKSVHYADAEAKPSSYAAPAKPPHHIEVKTAYEADEKPVGPVHYLGTKPNSYAGSTKPVHYADAKSSSYTAPTSVPTHQVKVKTAYEADEKPIRPVHYLGTKPNGYAGPTKPVQYADTKPSSYTAPASVPLHHVEVKTAYEADEKPVGPVHYLGTKPNGYDGLAKPVHYVKVEPSGYTAPGKPSHYDEAEATHHDVLTKPAYETDEKTAKQIQYDGSASVHYAKTKTGYTAQAKPAEVHYTETKQNGSDGSAKPVNYAETKSTRYSAPAKPDHFVEVKPSKYDRPTKPLYHAYAVDKRAGYEGQHKQADKQSGPVEYVNIQQSDYDGRYDSPLQPANFPGANPAGYDDPFKYIHSANTEMTSPVGAGRLVDYPPAKPTNYQAPVYRFETKTTAYDGPAYSQVNQYREQFHQSESRTEEYGEKMTKKALYKEMKNPTPASTYHQDAQKDSYNPTTSKSSAYSKPFLAFNTEKYLKPGYEGLMKDYSKQDQKGRYTEELSDNRTTQGPHEDKAYHNDEGKPQYTISQTSTQASNYEELVNSLEPPYAMLDKAEKQSTRSYKEKSGPKQPANGKEHLITRAKYHNNEYKIKSGRSQDAAPAPQGRPSQSHDSDRRLRSAGTQKCKENRILSTKHGKRKC